MASTAAPSAPFLSPRPIQREAARAAASVTRTSSMARLRSGRCFSVMRGRYSAWFNGSVGQLSDPYQQGEDDEMGITISGLPGDLLEPERPTGPVADADLDDDEDDAEASDEGLTGDSIAYDLADWSEIERQAITERLREAGVPHGWEGTQLMIAAVDEGVVENVLDIVEGESDDEAPEPLDPERDQVAYGVEELEDEELDALADALRAAGVAHAWGDEELYVYAEDEDAVDEVFEKVQHPDELQAEDDETPRGTASADLLGDVFVAADRLQHDGDDSEGTVDAARHRPQHRRPRRPLRHGPARLGVGVRRGRPPRRRAGRRHPRRGEGDGDGPRGAGGDAPVRVTGRPGPTRPVSRLRP